MAKTSPKMKAKIAAQSNDVFQAITEKNFASLRRAVKSAVSDKDEAAGRLNSVIANAVEKKHLHKRAFAIFRTLDRMSDTKLAETLAHLDHYRDIGKLDERAEQQAQMFERPEVGEDELPENVHRFGSQRDRELAAEFEQEAEEDKAS